MVLETSHAHPCRVQGAGTRYLRYLCTGPVQDTCRSTNTAGGSEGAMQAATFQMCRIHGLGGGVSGIISSYIGDFPLRQTKGQREYRSMFDFPSVILRSIYTYIDFGGARIHPWLAQIGTYLAYYSHNGILHPFHP